MSFATALARARMIFCAALVSDDFSGIPPHTATYFNSVTEFVSTFEFSTVQAKRQRFVSAGSESVVSVKTASPWESLKDSLQLPGIQEPGGGLETDAEGYDSEQ
jgi:hypothetical protein